MWMDTCKYTNSQWTQEKKKKTKPSISLVIREKQIKATMKYRWIIIRMAKMKKINQIPKTNTVGSHLYMESKTNKQTN